MSILIDDLIKYVELTNNKQLIEKKYYVTKWYGGSGSRMLMNRLKDAIRVLKGTSRAYHFKEDE